MVHKKLNREELMENFQFFAINFVLDEQMAGNLKSTDKSVDKTSGLHFISFRKFAGLAQWSEPADGYAIRKKFDYLLH